MFPLGVAKRREGSEGHAGGMSEPERDRAAARQLSATPTDEGESAHHSPSGFLVGLRASSE